MLRYFWPSDDEQLAGQWHDSHFDEDAGWWVSTLQAGAIFALSAVLSVGATTTAAATGVFSQSQDDPAGSLATVQFAQEDYWQNPVGPVNWPQPSVLTDDDTHVQFVQTFTPDDGDWKQLVAPVPDGNYIVLPFLDPEEIPVGSFPAVTNPVDDSAIWSPTSPPWDFSWPLAIYLDDGSWVPVFQPDEDFAGPWPAPYNWPQPVQAFSDSDENNLVAEFVAAEEPIWLQLVLSEPGSLKWPQQFTFEQFESTNLVAFTTEEYALPLVAPVPDSIWLLRQDAFEQHDATGSLTLTLDDSFQPLVIPGTPFPDPGGLRLLQQWPFEQNEPAGSLRNNVDEDFLPVQALPVPVVWPQPSVFTFDESIQTFTAVFQPDADFWPNLVFLPAPVQATNFIAPFTSPGTFGSLGEETPVLVAPPPVVPCFMPLPPSGPDGDTSISVFTQGRGPGNRPVLALFCRICHSGNPLVVRGDYAIWCQDCCAFVSKQDTYMGTVQAPGQFRGTF